MKTTLKKLQVVSRFIGHAVSWLLILMTLISVLIVVLRYGFNVGSIAMQESVIYLHVMVFILAAGYTLQDDAHVRVDIFYQKMNYRKKALVNLFGTLFLLIPFCLFTLWTSLPYVQRSWAIAEKSADAGGIPAVYLLKSFLIVLVVVLLFQAMIEIIKNILVLLDKDEHTDFVEELYAPIKSREGI